MHERQQQATARGAGTAPYPRASNNPMCIVKTCIRHGPSCRNTVSGEWMEPDRLHRHHTPALQRRWPKGAHPDPRPRRSVRDHTPAIGTSGPRLRQPTRFDDPPRPVHSHSLPPISGHTAIPQGGPSAPPVPRDGPHHCRGVFSFHSTGHLHQVAQRPAGPHRPTHYRPIGLDQLKTGVPIPESIKRYVR